MLTERWNKKVYKGLGRDFYGRLPYNAGLHAMGYGRIPLGHARRRKFDHISLRTGDGYNAKFLKANIWTFRYLLRLFIMGRTPLGLAERFWQALLACQSIHRLHPRAIFMILQAGAKLS